MIGRYSSRLWWQHTATPWDDLDTLTLAGCTCFFMDHFLGFSGGDTFNDQEWGVAYIHIVTFHFPLRFEHSKDVVFQQKHHWYYGHIFCSWSINSYKKSQQNARWRVIISICDGTAVCKWENVPLLIIHKNIKCKVLVPAVIYDSTHHVIKSIKSNIICYGQGAST